MVNITGFEFEDVSSSFAEPGKVASLFFTFFTFVFFCTHVF